MSIKRKQPILKDSDHAKINDIEKQFLLQSCLELSAAGFGVIRRLAASTRYFRLISGESYIFE